MHALLLAGCGVACVVLFCLWVLQVVLLSTCEVTCVWGCLCVGACIITGSARVVAWVDARKHGLGCVMLDHSCELRVVQAQLQVRVVHLINIASATWNWECMRWRIGV